MNPIRHPLRALLPGLALLLASASPRLAAQGPLLTPQPFDGGGWDLDYASSPTNRFVLLTGLSVDAIATPAATNDGRAGTDRFSVTLEPDLPARFFRLLVVPAPEPASTNLPSAALNVSARPGVVFAPAADRGVAFIAPVDLVLSALVSDQDGVITRVEFLVGDTVLAQVTAPPFLFEWRSLPVGAHAVRVRATDNDGNATTSDAWNITVGANTPPAVTLTDPADGTTWGVGSRLRLVANATDPNPGGVGRVEFRVNGSRLADVYAPPFAADWTPTLPGLYALTATAWDAQGAATVSGAVGVRAVPTNSLPSVALLAPVAGARFEQATGQTLTVTLTAAAADPDGTVQRVEFFAGGDKIAEAYPPLFTALWTNPPIGAHLLTALAVDDTAATALSAPVPVEVTAEGGVPTAYSLSPSPGESGVSVNRETILRFHRELSSNAVVTTDTLFATAAGRRILARVELSRDRRKATLFFLENLPASARVQVTFHGDRVLDRFDRPVDGDLDGRYGGTGRFEFETAASQPVAGTAVIGRVFASEFRVVGGATNWVNTPLENVTVTVDGREQDLRAVTDAEGNFRLTNAPAGRFFVHVDGRTAVGGGWPTNAYYPFVGKAWEAVAGVETNLAGGTGEIFLPLIPAAALQTVSATQVTPVDLDPDRTPIIIVRPRLFVPANALVADNGTRGGRVGMALVEPDRLPEPLPAGLAFPLVVTIQTDGPQNFDQPAPFEFPNLPDPVTGRKLNVGDKTALWSFNHDTGQWEVQGSMTIQLVERDGQMVEMAVTDPGVGVLQPGWHGTQPGGSGSGPLVFKIKPVRPVPPVPPVPPVSAIPVAAALGIGFQPTRSVATHDARRSTHDDTARTPEPGGYFYCLVDAETTNAPVRRGKVSAPSARLFAGLILPPSRRHLLLALHRESGLGGWVDFISPANGQRAEIPPLELGSFEDVDRDADGLSGLVEFIVGTDPGNADTDGDGIGDGTEVANGTDPVSGLAVRTGVVASAPMPGTALDVCALNNLAVVAGGSAGVSVFNVLAGLTPALIAQVDTPGSAHAVACAPGWIAVADGPAGLAIVDIRAPADAQVAHQLPLGADVRAVAVAGLTAYAGLRNGQVVAVDLPSGAILQRVTHGESVQDLAVDGDALLVALDSLLVRHEIRPDGLRFNATATLSGLQPEGLTGRRRVTAGGGLAYVTAYPGFDVFDTADPLVLVRVGNVAEHGPNSFKQIVPNGTGLGVAAVGVNPRNDGTHDVYLYDLSEPAITTRFQNSLPTPDVAHALSLYNGLAYVADGAAGLQVVNYLAYDNRGQAPAVTLASNLRSNLVEEGGVFRVTARVTDDVQVRAVEFFLDGVRVLTDGNFPFEARLTAPLLGGGRSNVVIHAVAADTGGNRTRSADLVIALADDLTPPAVASVTPAAGTMSPPNSVTAVAATFDEPVDPASVTFTLATPGPDGVPGSDDDVPVPGGTLTLRPDNQTAVLGFPAALTGQTYRATVSAGYRDAAGNAGAAFSWTFDARPREVRITGSLAISASDFSRDNGDLVVQPGATLTLAGAHRFNSLAVAAGATVTAPSGVRLDLAVAGDVVVAADAVINLMGKGHPGAQFGNAGPGGGQSSDWGGGGSHGGAGGVSTSSRVGGPTYGSVFEPAELGSGGGDRTASGDHWPGHGGGALRLSVGGTLTVDGVVQADGGDANYGSGGGSGGSVWLSAARLAGTGTIRANGGRDPSNLGGGGGGGRVAVHAGEQAFSGTLQACGGNGYEKGGAGTVYVRVGGGLGTVTVDNCGQAGASTELSGGQAWDAHLLVGPGGRVGPRRQETGFHLSVTGDVTVAAGGEFTAFARGHVGAQFGNAGPGGGQSSDWGGGGSHGGAGGVSTSSRVGGPTYGSVFEPAELGSGGGDRTASGDHWPGHGGGALRLSVGGTLTVDGVVQADGGDANYGSGGGSGGSVWLSAARLAGTGTIRANGGRDPSNLGGGGGGGRVAVHFVTNDMAVASIRAYGGGGYQDGAAGTVYLRQSAQSGGVLHIQNNPAYTGVVASTDLAGVIEAAELIIGPNGWVSSRPGEPLDLRVNGDVLIETGGRLDVSGRGHGAGQGPGAGFAPNYRSGASHGGKGGRGLDAPLNGLTYGSFLEPFDLGSGGGGSSGGTGGGALRLTVTGRLEVNGTLAANGDASGLGGGAGGSLWIEAAHVTGSGTVSVNGGNGGANEGGGGGGRLAIYFDVLDDTIRDALQARGGDGYQQGGSGTIWLQRRADALGELIINGPALTKDTAPTELYGDVWVPGTLRVRSGVTLTHPHGRPLNLTVLGGLNIASGARFTANGRGYFGGTGPGASDGGWPGAGHGGRGGNATGGGGRQGGPVYGDPAQPIDLGSGGNASGGGALRLSVLGTLSVQGELSSDGDGHQYGGGAGGSLYVRAGRVTGSGLIAARGGASQRGDAGAGGGGRIALYYHGTGFDTNRVSVAAGNGGGVGQPGSLDHVVRGLGDAPAVVAAFGSPSLTEVAVVFDHLLDWTTSQETNRYSLSGGLAVLGAELQHDLRTVILRTTPQAAGTAYTVTVDGVQNGLGVAAAAGASAGFTAATVARGTVREEVFYDVPGSRLGDLYASPNWPAVPDLVGAVNSFKGDTDSLDGDQLGARITGYLIPAVSGWHTFYFASDDNGVLYLGQDHTRDNLRLIASEPLRSQRGDWATSTVADIRTWRGYPPANISVPVWLEAGRWYWVDARVKEGASAEHLGVTWQAPGEEPPPLGQATRLSGDLIAPPAP